MFPDKQAAIAALIEAQHGLPVHKKNRKPNDDSRRRSAFAAELYRQERGRHWQPRGLTKNDRLEVTRRHSPEWRS